MAADFIKTPIGSGEPQSMGQILKNFFVNSNEPLAVAFRQKHPEVFEYASAEEDSGNQLFKDIHPNTELGIDLKLITREPGRMEVGAFLDGAITHDGEDHFTFIQNAGEKKKVDVSQRNPHVYEGKRINVNRKDDGTLYPTFNRPRYTENLTFQDFCREAADELYMIAGCFIMQNSGLVGKESVE